MVFNFFSLANCAWANSSVTSWCKSWNFHIKILELKSLIVWKLCTFLQRSNFISFIVINFDWIGNFEFCLLHRKDLSQIYLNIPYNITKNIFFSSIENQFLRNKLKFWCYICIFFLIYKFINLIYKFWWLHSKVLLKTY